MKKVIQFTLIIFTIFFINPGYAQQPIILWQSFYDGPINSVDYFKHMVIDNTGNVYVLCGTKGEIDQYDVNITTYKIDTSGQVEWISEYNKPIPTTKDKPIDIIYDPSGYVISMGNLNGAGIVVIKYALDGETEWVYHSSSNDDYAYTMTGDSLGNIYIAGKTKVQGTGNYDGIILKIAKDGSLLFRKNYIFGGTNSVWNTEIVKMITNKEGKLIFIGNCKRTKGSYYSCFVAKIDQNGNEQWKYVHLSDSLYMGSFYQANICIDGDNNVYAASAASTGKNGYSDYLVFRLDNATGNQSWLKKLEGGNGGPDNVKSIHADNKSNIYLSGYSRYLGQWFSHVIFKMNVSDGDLLWEKEIRNYGTAGYHKFSINDFCLDDKGNFYISSQDIIDDLKKYTPEGDTIWSIDVPGAFRGSAYPYNNWMDIHISTVIKGDNGKIYFGCSGTEGGNSDYTDVMVAVLTGKPTGVDNDDLSLSLMFSLLQNYPNPFNTTTTIKYKIPEQDFVTLTVFDALGKEVATLVSEEKPAGNYEVEFDAQKLNNGTYYYKLSAASFAQSRKMMVLK
ncbi:MAG: T9SS type A sorting domain-containing protein [Bacteroidales bacterium]|nr:T9SS type A sorting domain-containing protein [Bacteroidales bacterium]